MNISSLIPIDVPPHLSGQVHEALVEFLGDLVGQKHLDTKIAPASVRIICAFADLEKKGTIEAFRAALHGSRREVGPTTVLEDGMNQDDVSQVETLETR